MENYKTSRNTERKINLLGHTKAKEFALRDMASENISGGIIGLLEYSVKRQLLAFNTINVIELESIISSQKKIPEPPIIISKRYKTGYKNYKVYKKQRTSRYEHKPLVKYNEYVDYN